VTVTPPEPVPLIVSAEDVAVEVDIPLPLDPAVEAMLERAIRRTQSDVEAYLGRPITPVTVVARGVLQGFDGAWVLDSPDDVIDIVSVAAETSGVHPAWTYQVTYLSGLDARADRMLAPIRSYVLWAAVNAPPVVRYWETNHRQQGQLVSVSAGDQSATFSRQTLGGGGKAGSGAPGALPTLDSLAQWRRLGVWQRRG
jgi:hypothetical protein